jgi:DNA-binding transcriptional regulator YiaG
MDTIHPIQAFRESQTPPLSRADFGVLVGADRATVFRWETGTRKVDSAFLLKVSEVTGIPARDLRPDLAALFEAAE